MICHFLSGFEILRMTKWRNGEPPKVVRESCQNLVVKKSFSIIYIYIYINYFKFYYFFILY